MVTRGNPLKIALLSTEKMRGNAWGNALKLW